MLARVFLTSLFRCSILLLLLPLTACRPTITFTGESVLDGQGNEYGRLEWRVTGKDTDEFQLTGVTIEPDIGPVEPSGVLLVYPSQTTTYTLTAFSVGPNSTVYNATQSVTIHIGPRIDYRRIMDRQLRTCLQSTGFTHVAQFTAIYCVDRGIVRLEGIEQFTEAQSVSLDLNRVQDLTPLAALPRLNLVSVSSNQLTRLDGLTGSASLRNIVAMNNQIDDVAALAAMPNLVSLVLDNNQLFDTVGLESLTALQGLSITRNQIVDVSALAALTELRALDFSHNPVTTGVPALRSLTKAVAIRSEGNRGVRCLDYANLVLALGPVVIFDQCRLF